MGANAPAVLYQQYYTSSTLSAVLYQHVQVIGERAKEREREIRGSQPRWKSEHGQSSYEDPAYSKHPVALHDPLSALGRGQKCRAVCSHTPSWLFLALPAAYIGHTSLPYPVTGLPGCFSFMNLVRPASDGPPTGAHFYDDAGRSQGQSCGRSPNGDDFHPQDPLSATSHVDSSVTVKNMRSNTEEPSREHCQVWIL